ncbi:PREDICTED: proton pump-interactor 1-like [Nicotiana attenuata]|uniref:proton pump-interactor 1-like n=1 Tax=Nicotiana attenuata TaxID=49451 RepID=UPI00090583AF|nr:PREDICTED: proton pump-interactor 1-like [Nicotiana attenuata]
MGIDVESQLAHVSVENKILKDNGRMNNVAGVNDPIKVGSHGIEEPIKEERKRDPLISLRENAVDEWPQEKQVHSFYIVKYRRFEDQKLKSKIEQAEIELQKKNKARSQIIEKLKLIRADRAQLIEQRKSLSAENQQFWTKIDEKRKEVKPLHDALGELRGARNTGGERGYSLCSSEEELNNLIKSLEYRIQHESIPLNEEKQILREIKQLEGTRENVKKNAAMRADILESKGDKESIQNQVKLISVDLDGVRKEQQAVKAKLKKLDDHIDDITKQIKSLDEEVKEIVKKRESTYEHILELRKQRDEGNSPFYKNSTMLQKAKQLADKKDIEALKELSLMEAENFMSLWSVDKAFRDDYERRILSSLDIRQLSKDGRMRNPDEKPLVSPEARTASQTEVAPKTNVDPPKEDPVSTAKLDASATQKVQKEKNSKELKDANGKNTSTLKEDFDFVDGNEEVYGLEKLPEDTNAKRNGVDEVKLREMKREEEIAKNRQAMERKKKLAEKAAAKAALKAQKEAEKKLKDLEKKARKKAGAVVTGQDPMEEPTETTEEEKAEEKVETPVAPKVKECKENTVRHRATRAKGSELPKVILKHKKGRNYWQWAAPAALVVLLLLVAAYKYML